MRRMMIEPGDLDPIYFLSQYLGYFTFPKEMGDDEEYVATSYIATDRRFLLTRRHDPHVMQVILSCESARLKDIPRGNVEKEKQALEDIFKGAGWKTPEFLQALREADDFYLERPGVVKLDAW